MGSKDIRLGRANGFDIYLRGGNSGDTKETGRHFSNFVLLYQKPPRAGDATTMGRTPILVNGVARFEGDGYVLDPESKQRLKSACDEPGLNEDEITELLLDHLKEHF